MPSLDPCISCLTWEATLVRRFDRAVLESVPPYKFHLLLPQSRVPIPCHSASNETGSYQVFKIFVMETGGVCDF